MQTATLHSFQNNRSNTRTFSPRKLFYFRCTNPSLLLTSQADVEANFLVVKAYEFTTITSVTLLDCFTVPCVVVLSAIFLGPCFATFAPSQSTGVRCAEFQRAAFPMLALAGFVRTGVRYKALHGVGIIACVLGTSPPAATCNRMQLSPAAIPAVAASDNILRPSDRKTAQGPP